MSGYAGRRTAGIAVALLAVVIARYGYNNFGWFFLHIALPESPVRSLTWLLTRSVVLPSRRYVRFLSPAATPSFGRQESLKISTTLKHRWKSHLYLLCMRQARPERR